MNTKRMIILGIVAAVGLALGYFTSLMYAGVTGSLASMTSACRLLRTAESAGVLSKAQRDSVIDELLARSGNAKDRSAEAQAKRDAGTAMIADSMKGDCNLLKVN